MKADLSNLVKPSDTSSVTSTSNQPPKPAALARMGKTNNLPRLSNQKTKMESDEDSSSSSLEEPPVVSSHTNPRSSKQTEKKTVIDLNQLDDIYHNGKAEDQFKYGQMYEEGNGVDRGYEEALKWYHRAADQNHPDAQFKLGVMYANGIGVEKNVDRARSWFCALEYQGHTKAQSDFDSLNLSKEDLTKNLTPIFEWHMEAAKKGNIDSYIPWA